VLFTYQLTTKRSKILLDNNIANIQGKAEICQRAGVNVTDNSGYTPLILAAKTYSYGMMDFVK